MQLTHYTDYALRTLIFLGLTERGGTIGQVAAAYGISKNHLVKVVHHLGKLGYLKTTRGKAGGIRLAAPPGAINIGEFVRQVEPNFHMVECFNPERNACPITPECRLKGVLCEATDAFLEVLDRYTLEDLLTKRDALRASLQLSER